MRYFFPLSPYNQQRQFEKPVWVYPAHLAMYATYLKQQGHQVWWDVNPDDFHQDDIIITNDNQDRKSVV